MGRKSKLISVPRRGSELTWEEREKMIKDYLSSNLSKQEIWKKYTGQEIEHGQIIKWMRILGYDKSLPERRPNAIIPAQMNKKSNDANEQSSFEVLQLNKRILELEKQLRDAEMKAIAFSTMIDVAEKELKISIKKKYDTKPSKK